VAFSAPQAGALFVDIMTALATASQAIKLAQDLRGIDKAMDAAEYKLKIADLNAALSDIKPALTEAKTELVEKDTEIERLTKALRRAGDLIEYQGYRYDKGANGTAKGAPYCPVCEQKGMLVHIAKVLHAKQCPNCKGFFDGHFFGHG
jgi:hypothetical protein